MSSPYGPGNIDRQSEHKREDTSQRSQKEIPAAQAEEQDGKKQDIVGGQIGHIHPQNAPYGFVVLPGICVG